MSNNEMETNSVNGSNSQSNDLPPAGVLDRGRLVVIMGILLLVSEVECYLLSEPKIRGYRKKSLSLWLQKGTF